MRHELLHIRPVPFRQHPHFDTIREPRIRCSLRLAHGKVVGQWPSLLCAELVEVLPILPLEWLANGRWGARGRLCRLLEMQECEVRMVATGNQRHEIHVPRQEET